jgi:hypothetical protein
MPATATKRSGARKTTTRKASAPKRPSVKTGARGRISSAARTRHESNRRAIDRIKKALDTTQKEITAIRGSLGTGRKDLRKDVAKALREARRDVEKMNKAVVGDLERIQKELTGAAKAAKPRRTARKASGRSSAKRRP